MCYFNVLMLVHTDFTDNFETNDNEVSVDSFVTEQPAETEVVSFETKDLNSDEFSFAHLSDSQSLSGSGFDFSRTMNALSGNCDFVIHTGDIVEKGKYVSEWKEMLHRNFSILYGKTALFSGFSACRMGRRIF